ncbi:MAG: hypothetical protein ACJAVY_000805 [Marinoscillum sp.]|jgi:hypothetical protein
MNTITTLSKKFLFAAALGVAAISVQAQEMSETTMEAQAEEAPAFSLSGTVDTYFKANPGYGASATPNTSFTSGTGFSMGMVNLVGSYEGEKTGVVADLVFGPRGIEAAFGAPIGGSIVNQMYAYWNVSDKVTLTMGQWNTFLGYEVISPAANINYSTSYMFSWGPFSQSGLKADFALSDDLSLMIALMNPTDVLETNVVGPDGADDFNYTLGFQLGYKGTYLNARYGDASGELFQVDLTGGYDLTETFYLGVNATILDDGANGGFIGAAIYPKIAISETFAIAARAEYFAVSDNYGGILATDVNGDGNVINLTLSANYMVGPLTLIPEVRIDMTSEDNYADTDGKASSSLPTLILAAVYSF